MARDLLDCRMRVLLGAVPIKVEPGKSAGSGVVPGVVISGILLPVPMKPPDSSKEKQVCL